MFCLISPGFTRVASAQRVLEQRPRPHALVARLPDGVAFQASDGGHTLRLAAALPALDHALERLQGVEAEDLQIAPRRHHHILELPPERDLERRAAAR